MLDLINEGGPLFMGILSIIGTAMLALSVFNLWSIYNKKFTEASKNKISQIKEVGLLALIVGVLATTVSLMGAFEAIEAAGDVSMSLLAGGLKYATYTIVYGMIIYILSILISMGLRWKVNMLSTD